MQSCKDLIILSAVSIGEFDGSSPACRFWGGGGGGLLRLFVSSVIVTGVYRGYWRSDES